MKVVDTYVQQATYKSGAEVCSGHKSLSEAMAAHNSALSAGAVGSAVFTDDGEEVTSSGEGPALVYDKGALKKINPAPVVPPK